MIKAKGTYLISVNNILVSQDNLLLTGYYNTNFGGNIHLAVGDSMLAIDYDNEAIPGLATSDAQGGLTGGTSFTVDAVEFTVTQQQDFSFGLGNDFTLNEIGLVSNNTLVSRSLLDSSVTVSPADMLLARYILQYTFSRAPISTSINYKGNSIPANVYFVNPNKWTNTKLGQPMIINTVGVGTGWSINNNASLTGSFALGEIQAIEDQQSSNNTKQYSAGFISNLNDLTGTFDQIILCNGTAGPANALVLIELNQTITKTDKDTLSLTLTITQEP